MVSDLATLGPSNARLPAAVSHSFFSQTKAPVKFPEDRSFLRQGDPFVRFRLHKK
jgi:hypothetical protein